MEIVYETTVSGGGTKIVGTECIRARENRLRHGIGPQDKAFRSFGYVGGSNTVTLVETAIQQDYSNFIDSEKKRVKLC